jgi:NAD(P)-dependent dehydrogenase (short-subunit alcohol dehydrogenase family)
MAGLQREYGRLDLVVNLASIYEPAGILSPESRRNWTAHLAANTTAAYDLSILAAPVMARHGGGRIVHVADWTGASGRPRYKGYTAYYVSKAAVTSLTESLAFELAPRILVNAIAPGPILPPPGLSERERRAVEKATPLGRWGGADEVAKAVIFLAETDFVTGETVRVDGGRHLY